MRPSKPAGSRHKQPARQQALCADEWMIEGDPNLEAVYSWTQDGQSLPFRGPEGTGTGVHILTGTPGCCCLLSCHELLAPSTCSARRAHLRVREQARPRSSTLNPCCARAACATGSPILMLLCAEPGDVLGVEILDLQPR